MADPDHISRLARLGVTWVRTYRDTNIMSADGDRPSHTEPLNVVVTGGTAGIGLETMKQLVAREGVFRILIGARTIPASETVESVRSLRSSPRTTIEYLPLDLTSPSSVETFADSLIETLKEARINILLLCAGMTPGSRRTVELLDSKGTVDETLYVNALSPARLVSRLFATLAQDARIAVVNSGRHLEAPSRMAILTNVSLELLLTATQAIPGSLPRPSARSLVLRNGLVEKLMTSRNWLRCISCSYYETKYRCLMQL